MFYPSAKIIADSVTESGDRLTTMVIKFHRYILPEINTHRMLSKNTSSSRAIPIAKMIALAESQEVYPLHWGKNQKGMNAETELSGDALIEAQCLWKEARENAIASAKKAEEIGLHKQVVNRLLEPFLSTTMIISGTNQSGSWENFFKQRCHLDAQPEMQALAKAMREAYDASEPEKLNYGEWHIPFISKEDLSPMGYIEMPFGDDLQIKKLIRIAVGRCARVSYLNHDGDRNIDDDIKLHDRLLTSKPAHLSPFEHIAQAKGGGDGYANFIGFQSYRNQLETKGI